MRAGIPIAAKKATTIKDAQFELDSSFEGRWSVRCALYVDVTGAMWYRTLATFPNKQQAQDLIIQLKSCGLKR